MSRFIYIIIIACLIMSCHSKNDEYKNCIYKSDMLLHDVDSSMLAKRSYPGEKLFEVLDIGSNIGAKGIYKFDENKGLRFYAFLLSDSNEYTFSRTYDSLGRVVDSSGGEVAQWYFRKMSKDSVRITFYLYSLNQAYNAVSLQIGSSKRIGVQLFNSPIFSNIVGGSFTTILDKDEHKKIYLKGNKTYSCSGDKYSFRDSTEVPQELFEK